MDKNGEKRGLVIVYDPHSLQQFVWYYCTYGQDIKWDALCLPNGYKGSYMDTYCVRTGVFENVFKGETDYLEMPFINKVALFLKMFGYYVIGKRKKCATEILESYVTDFGQYDECVAICETGFISGLLTMFGDEKKVSFLDDGLGEYVPRTKWSNTYKKTSSTYWQSFFLTRMGYSCKGRFYFEPTKYCYKYSSVTKEMLYTNYKVMEDFDMTNTNIALYDELLSKAYPNIEHIDFDDVDTVFFTDNLECFSGKAQEYYDKCVKYIEKNARSVLIKRHPRDDGKYDFAEGIRVQEVDSDVPAELILGRIQGKQIYFSYFSSIIIFMQQYGYEYNIMYSEDIYQDNLTSKTGTWHFPSREKVEGYCKRFSGDKYNFIDL